MVNLYKLKSPSLPYSWEKKTKLHQFAPVNIYGQHFRRNIHFDKTACMLHIPTLAVVQKSFSLT